MARVVLDARITRQMSVGMIAYVRELVARLPVVAPDLSFVVISNAELPLPATAMRVDLPERLATNGSLAEQAGLARILRARAGKVSLTHLMSVYAPLLAPRPYVYTIHDLIHRRFPQYFKWKVRPYYSLVVGPVARRAAAVITDARATVPDLQRYLGVKPACARVVPLGVDERYALDDAARARRGEQARERFALRAPFLLYAGNHREHKNLETLAAAWHALSSPCDLVVTESMPFAFDIDRYAKSGSRIVRTGHVSDDELIALYAGCAATVQPSLYEGFGLSVLEGMAAGAPVIVAQTPALVETASDCALTFPPFDVTALQRAIERVLAAGPDIERLRARARERARSFSWDETARRTADLYRECLP
ncbi:MAG: glycosyltransferase family 4 protein [Candidatus Eremiobacteraeota bacterium]|nr:glycosyltransferase family 4 protein [Candidatus Eremiobacteraeota bacterium]